MKRKIMLSILTAIILACLLPSVLALEHNCRMWASFGNVQDTQQQLLNGTHSLKQLGEQNRNGWGMVSYASNGVIVTRGALPASQDATFDAAVMNLSGHITIVHDRLCSSGCCNIPDPHPFTKTFLGRTWSFAHNGNVNKGILTELIGDAYLQDHPVQTCPDNPIDSELYFIYIEKLIEKHDGNVEQAIYEATAALLSKGQSTLNFILSDGTTLWAYKQGNTLSYTYDLQHQTTVVASEPTAEGWTALEEGQLLVVKQGEFPLVVSMQENPSQDEVTDTLVATPTEQPQTVDDITRNIIMGSAILVMLVMFITMLTFLFKK